MTVQAIHTKYFGPSNVRGSRIKAQCDAGSLTVGYDHALDVEGNHAAAAEALRKKLGWNSPYYGKLAGGALPKENGYAFVFVQ